MNEALKHKVFKLFHKFNMSPYQISQHLHIDIVDVYEYIKELDSRTRTKD